MIMNSACIHIQDQLYAAWGVKSVLPLVDWQKRLLQKYMEYIFISDWLTHLEGGADQLTYPELIAVSFILNVDHLQIRRL